MTEGERYRAVELRDSGPGAQSALTSIIWHLARPEIDNFPSLSVALSLSVSLAPVLARFLQCKKIPLRSIFLLPALCTPVPLSLSSPLPACCAFLHFCALSVFWQILHSLPRPSPCYVRRFVELYLISQSARWKFDFVAVAASTAAAATAAAAANTSLVNSKLNSNHRHTLLRRAHTHAQHFRRHTLSHMCARVRERVR